jgi:leucyl-tRNA synthetase
VSAWPGVEKEYLIEEKWTVAVAVNGKVRSEIVIENNEVTNEQQILTIAKNDVKIKPWIDGKEIIKEIYITGKMVNIVIKQ